MGFRVAFVGDTLLGERAEPTLRRHGFAHALQGIGALTEDADLVVVNLEGVITRRNEPAANRDRGARRFWYRAEPESLDALREIGVRVVSVANNHVLDHGHEGLVDTLRHLDQAGIAHCGAGADEAAARRPALVEAAGARIAFLAALQPYRMYEDEGLYATDGRSGPLLLQPDVVRRDLDALAGEADVRILLVHWGRNYRAITGVQRELAGELRAGPADLVVGHHPHVAQRVELSPGCPVLFSIGNGAFPTGRGRFARRGVFGYGLVATAEFDDAHRLRGLDLALLDVENERVEFAPRAACGDHARSYLRGLAPPRDGWVEAPGPHARATVRL